MEVATHWLGARDPARARAALVRAVEESEAVYAYRDATAAGRQALELWPGDEDPAGRLEVLERYARCAERAGELPEAVKAWRELSAVRSARGERLAFADAQRRLAAAHELRASSRSRSPPGVWPPTPSPPAERPADAALERLGDGQPPSRRADFSEAMELARVAVRRGRGRRARGPARAGARARGRRPRQARRVRGRARDRARGAGARARGGSDRRRRRALPAARARALRLGRLSPREEALDTALGLCQVDGEESTEVACVTCLAYVLRERGEWSRTGSCAAS
jgi:hypothetical protein